MSTHHSPCVMTTTDDFYVRICGCGVVHLSFGPTTLNLSPQAAIAVSETLKEVSSELRQKLNLQPSRTLPPAMVLDPSHPERGVNVIQGNFRK